jgi:pimeloyl-ACP methyl ester carboxylesterase
MAMPSDALDREVEAAHAAVLDRLAPGTQSHRVRWSQGETRVLELGSGPPLLLIHGGFDNAVLWAPILTELAARRRVLAVDLPGHGLADPFDYAKADLAAVGRTFLGEILDGLELDDVDIAACSIGGFVGTVFALDAPDRVKRLVLVGAPLGVARYVPTPLWILGFAIGLPLVGKALGRLAFSRPSRENTRKLMGMIAVAHPERVDDGMLDADVPCQRRNRDSYIALMRCLASLATPRGVRPRFVLGERWHGLRVPTTFLCGQRDAFMAPRVERTWEEIVARNPNIRIVRIPDAGHLVWLDAPDVVMREIEEALDPSEARERAATHA